ncbi:MAG: hemerythrin protein [Herminiimonas sp.]|nr:hemerythrin protein [Herminiimonas sp.]
MTTAKHAAANRTDAISILTDDHKNVKKLFKDFEKMKDKGDVADKEALVDQICAELTVHAEVEEEVFYPAARKAIKDDDMLNEAEVEHAGAKDLIEQIQSMDSSDPMYDAKVTVLGEYIDHHVEEEEKEMFPKARKTKLDLEALGEQIAALKETKQTRVMSGNGKQPRSGSSSARA